MTDRKELIERLEDLRAEANTNMAGLLSKESRGALLLCDFIHRMDAGLRDSLAALSPEWIPVSERLPEVKEGGYSDTVLAYVESGQMYSAWIVDFDELDRGWRSDRYLLNEIITHWQPLPAPPED